MPRAKPGEILSDRVFGSTYRVFDVDGAMHQCEVQVPFKPEGYDYRIQDITLLNDPEGTSGAVFRIRSETTRIMHVTHPTYHSKRWVVQGYGCFLRMDPEGTVHVDKVTAMGRLPGYFYHIGPGWVDCMIAGERGITVAEFSQPAFDPSYEEEVPVWSGLSDEFWSEYERLTNPRPLVAQR